MAFREEQAEIEHDNNILSYDKTCMHAIIIKVCPPIVNMEAQMRNCSATS